MRVNVTSTSTWNGIARFSSRYSILVIGSWFLVVVAGNLLVPQIESVARAHGRGLLPEGAQINIAAHAMAEQFQDGIGNNVTYLVLESDHRLGTVEKAFHDQLVAKIRADTASTESVLDLWADPMTSQAVVSADGSAVYTMLRLRGELGDGTAVHAVEAVRQMVLGERAPPGLRVYVTGPGAIVADQITTMDKQMLMITGLTAVLIATLLLFVYRSAITPAVPLLTVGIALAAARPIVAFLGAHDLIEVSFFSAALLAALVLGSATDYGIFLLGRYHEQRRAGAAHEDALAVANRTVSPVIGASGLTVAAALSCLVFAHVGVLRSTGLPCAIGVLVGMVASLTFLPALLSIVGRRGLAQPRPARGRPGHRWRGIGTIVARWPTPVLVGSALVLIVCAIPVASSRLGFDELDVLPQSTHLNRAFAAMDRHFPPNRLLPEIVSITSSQDLRNPAGLIAIERVSKKVMDTPGIYLAQSASRPTGSIPEQAALTAQVGIIADQLDDGMTRMSRRIGSIEQLSSTLNQLSSAGEQLQNGLAGGVGGLAQINGGIDEMESGLKQLRDNVTQVSGYIDPLRIFTNSNPNCINDSICSLALQVVQPMDSVVKATDSITNSASSFGIATQSMAKGFAEAELSLNTMRTALRQLNTMASEMKQAVGETRSQFSELIEYLRRMRVDFQNSGEAGFYLPQQAWQDPRFRRATQFYFSPDGRSTRMLVFGEGKMSGPDGAHRSADILEAVREATKEGTLTGSTIIINGFGTGIAELHEYAIGDFQLLASVSLTLVFLIVLVMLRSPVAAAVVIGTVVVSYATAIGISTLIWQDILGKDLHWPVTSIALIALVAVGSDYNLLLTMRMREEIFQRGAGLRTGTIRAIAGTGGVVSIAGIVFGITMFALLAGDMLSIQQVGATIGVGLMIDTLIVRTFLVPALAGVLGRWFWWTPVPIIRSLSSHWSKSRAPRMARPVASNNRYVAPSQDVPPL